MTYGLLERVFVSKYSQLANILPFTNFLRSLFAAPRSRLHVLEYMLKYVCFAEKYSLNELIGAHTTMPAVLPMTASLTFDIENRKKRYFKAPLRPYRQNSCMVSVKRPFFHIVGSSKMRVRSCGCGLAE